jgi:dTDP-4-dehydrorhamnose 3,5-epimerase
MAVTGHPAGVLRTPSMQVTALDLPDAYLVTPRRIADARGFFVEHYNKRTLAAHGLHFEFIQDNASLSVRKGTVRGLHFQTPPSSQTKLVSVMSGAVLDVMVDIRHGSPAYGRHIAVELTAESGQQLLVPRGMAHGYCTLADDTLVLYKVDAFYDPERDKGLQWDDPDLGIRWPVPAADAVLTDKDRKHPRLRDLPRYFEWTGT